MQRPDVDYIKKLFQDAPFGKQGNIVLQLCDYIEELEKVNAELKKLNNFNINIEIPDILGQELKELAQILKIGVTQELRKKYGIQTIDKLTK